MVGGGGGRVGGGSVGAGSQGGCERRIEVFVKIKKKLLGWGVRGGGGSDLGGGGGGQDRCEPRSIGFVKIQKQKYFEILHLQNFDVKFQNFQRAITKKNQMIFFFKFHQIIYSFYPISC